jgi:protein involved in ribonucleotide reduction
MLNLVYFSNVTETTHRFVQKINLHGGKAYRIPLKGDFGYCMLDQYILITPTYGDHHGHGHLPPQVRKFLGQEDLRNMCVGVASAGNRNFGKEYGRAGDLIAAKLGIPLVLKFELAGDPDDISVLNHLFEKYNQNATPSHYTETNNQELLAAS